MFEYTHGDLFNPLLKAFKQRSGPASIRELETTVSEVLDLSDEEISEIHEGNTTKLQYRLAWARTYLKKFGLLENSSRGPSICRGRSF
jgi:restriction system protein